MTKRKTRRKINLLAIILAVLMLLPLAIPALASSLSTDDEQETLTGADILYEDLTKREQFAKHYVTGDGSYFAVSYAEQVNYQDENGAWIEVDNTMITDESSGDKSTKNDKFKIKFANKASKDKLVTIKTDEYKVSFGITMSSDGINYTKLSKIKGEEIESLKPNEGKTPKDVQSLGKAKSGIRYNGVYGEAVDLRYTVTHLKLKEDIILNEKTELHSYKVTYDVSKITDLVVFQREDGSVRFRNSSGKLLFAADAPIMYDSEGEASTDIEVTTVVNDKTVEVTYTPSSEWLDSDDRVYPVVIDPAVMSDQYIENVLDTSVYYLTEYNNTTYNAYSEILKVGAEYRNYIKILNAPYVSGNVSGVSLVLTVDSYSLYPDYVNHPNEPEIDMGIVTYNLSNVVSYWDELSFQSNEEDFYYDTEKVYYGPTTGYPQTSGAISLNNSVVFNSTGENDILTLNIPSEYYANNGYNNYFSTYQGFELIASHFVDIRCNSSESGNVSYRPALVVRYTQTFVSDSLVTPPIVGYDSFRLCNRQNHKYITFSETGGCYSTISPITNSYYEGQSVKFIYSPAMNAYTIYNETLDMYMIKDGEYLSCSYIMDNKAYWQLAFNTYGYYYLLNSYGGTTHCLTVNNNGGLYFSAYNPNLNNYYQMWKFEPFIDIINANEFINDTCSVVKEEGKKYLIRYNNQSATNLQLSNQYVVTKDTYGVITLQNIQGEVIITVADEVFFTLEVYNPTEMPLNLENGSYFEYSSRAIKLDTNFNVINWYSSNESVATINENGILRMNSTGYTTISGVNATTSQTFSTTVYIYPAVNNTQEVDDRYVYDLVPYSNYSSGDKKVLGIEPLTSYDVTDESYDPHGDEIPELMVDTNTINQMWRIKKVPDLSNVYYILSMNVDEPTSSDKNLMLGVGSSNQQDVKTAFTTTNNLKNPGYFWSFVTDPNNSDAINIVSRINGKYLNKSGNDFVLGEYSQSASQWKYFEQNIKNYTLNYMYHSDMIIDNTLYCRVDTSTWDTSQISYAEIENAINDWNDLECGINIVFHDPSEVDIGGYAIVLTMESEGDLYIGTPDFDFSPDNSLIVLSSIITIYTTAYNRLNAEQKHGALLHELGHALFLDDIIFENDDNNRFMSLMIKNGSDIYFRKHITNFDASAVCNKWGG